MAGSAPEALGGAEGAGLVEVVGVAVGPRELRRARTILGNWVGAASTQEPNQQPKTIASVRREIMRVENAIRGRDEAAVEELGGLNGCLHRLVEMRALLRSGLPGGIIHGYSVWVSSRFFEGGT